MLHSSSNRTEIKKHLWPTALLPTTALQAGLSFQLTAAANAMMSPVATSSAQEAPSTREGPCGMAPRLQPCHHPRRAAVPAPCMASPEHFHPAGITTGNCPHVNNQLHPSHQAALLTDGQGQIEALPIGKEKDKKYELDSIQRDLPCWQVLIWARISIGSMYIHPQPHSAATETKCLWDACKISALLTGFLDDLFLFGWVFLGLAFFFIFSSMCRIINPLCSLFFSPSHSSWLSG